MIYTPMTKKAMRLMFEVHKDQVDKSGTPYVFHPYHIAEQMQDEVSTVVALLHDVIEDTELTFDDLRRHGFSEEIVENVRLLTHTSDVDYYEYIRRIGTSLVARRVKIKDLEHNMEMSRLNIIEKYDIDRRKKYYQCHEYLIKLEQDESQAAVKQSR